jgi:glucose-6-phosphate 1-dehydrogenase
MVASENGGIPVEMPGREKLTHQPTEPFVMVIFGASGDLTKRLLVPALYNLECDGLLSKSVAVLGTATRPMSSEEYRAKLTGDEGIAKFHTRKEFDSSAWEQLVNRFEYMSGPFEDLEHFKRLKAKVTELDTKVGANGNVLFYFATSPSFFGLLCKNLHEVGFKDGRGWKRIIVEKPFGTSLESARKLNDDVLAHWGEEQIYRVDHYLGKETVQNLLAFRFANGMFEPLWNRNYIDNIQFNVAEAVDVQGRGGYYDHSGVLRDMMQNHMFQMLAYLCMETPGSFQPDAIRNEKAKLLQSVRVYSSDEVARYTVRGQYGPSFTSDGSVDKPGYRQELKVNPESKTETYAAARLHIDNLRWNGVPIYLRSGKALWKRGTEIVVEFKQPPLRQFRGTQIEALSANRLVFHIQPQQAIELLFQAKVPGPTLQLQDVDMVFRYGDAFKASRYTGYEVMIYSCSRGDATLFSRGDLVEAAWEVAQPILDYWAATPAQDFPNYARGSWGPKAAHDLIARDGRSWFEVVTPEMLEQSPLFKGANALLLNNLIPELRPRSVDEGETIVEEGSEANEMYLISRGEVDVLDRSGKVKRTLSDGDIFGEVGVLKSARRNATVRAKRMTDLFVLGKESFQRILHEHPQFAERICTVASDRYHVQVSTSELKGDEQSG